MTTIRYGSNRAHPVGLAPLDPNALMDYTIDWTDWLLPVTDTINTSVWIVPTGLTPTNPAIINTNTGTKVWLQVNDPLIVDTKQIITNRVTTAAGRIEDRSFEIRIEEKQEVEL